MYRLLALIGLSFIIAVGGVCLMLVMAWVRARFGRRGPYRDGGL